MSCWPFCGPLKAVNPCQLSRLLPSLQILDALVVLRDSRIVHCDLKPENVLLKTIETGEGGDGSRHVLPGA